MFPRIPQKYATALRATAATAGITALFALPHIAGIGLLAANDKLAGRERRTMEGTVLDVRHPSYRNFTNHIVVDNVQIATTQGDTLRIYDGLAPLDEKFFFNKQVSGIEEGETYRFTVIVRDTWIPCLRTENPCIRNNEYTLLNYEKIPKK